MDRAKRAGIWLFANWERVFFLAVGLAFLTACFRLVYNDNVTEAAVVFGISFLCFLYANVARFKRFKGLGFEAELWEDKQKEAADLIERLKSVVEIYTRETVMSRVTRMRLIKGPDWKENWDLYDRLTKQHDDLGQNIDFSTLKKEVDEFFLFDLCRSPESELRNALANATIEARAMIIQEFGDPITDADGYAKRNLQLAEAEYQYHDNDFETSQTNDLAGIRLSRYREKANLFGKYFGIEPQIDENAIRRLEHLSRLYRDRPVEVTPELIEWSKER